MVKLRFSRRAEADLLDIAEYTLSKGGKFQAADYLNEIENCCRLLADNPSLGRHCDDIRPGLHRHEHGKHVLFYRREGGGILISVSFMNDAARTPRNPRGRRRSVKMSPCVFSSFITPAPCPPSQTSEQNPGPQGLAVFRDLGSPCPSVLGFVAWFIPICTQIPVQCIPCQLHKIQPEKHPMKRKAK